MNNELHELTKVKVHICWLAYLRTNPDITYNNKPLSNFKRISKAIIEAMFRTTLYAELVHVLETTVFDQCWGIFDMCPSWSNIVLMAYMTSRGFFFNQPLTPKIALLLMFLM
eukprot:12797296-Ditylum_brightwellii.AAC.1